MFGAARLGADVAIAPDAAPISMWTIPAAVLNEQEGGGLEVCTLIVVPPFIVPETQVLPHPEIQRRQTVGRRKANEPCGSRR